MKICVVQTRPLKGDIQGNMDSHKKLITLAVRNGAETIIFPELSLTGYEPTLSKNLAVAQDDGMFDDFQQLSDVNNITIGVGMPIKSDSGILISMLIFKPHKKIETYSKQYLHPDEYPFFIAAQNPTQLTSTRDKIAFAICYELSVPEHSAEAYKNGAEIYIASVAKTAEGVEKAIKTLAGIAKKYSMTVLISNCVGQCDGVECGGKTSAWNNKGVLTGQLDNKNEGILIVDTDTDKITEIRF